jgi:hypothetical protein
MTRTTVTVRQGTAGGIDAKRLRAAREVDRRRVPTELLPHGLARQALLDLIRADCDVRVQRARRGGTRLVSIGALAWNRTDGRGCLTLDDWRKHYRAILAALRLDGVAAGVLGEVELRQGDIR